MMSDHHDAANARGDFELDELVAKINDRYSREGLSPPMQLRGAIRHWLGLSNGEIIAAIEQHSTNIAAFTPAAQVTVISGW